MSKYLSWSLLLVLTGAAGAAGQDVEYMQSVQEQNVPTWVALAFADSRIGDTHQVDFELNPFYLRGDFDGDGEPDVALHVRERKTSKRGIAVFHAAGAPMALLGAGQPFGNGGDDFGWMWIWKVFPADYNPRRYHESLPADAIATEALFVQKPESASGVIYWNGRDYVWRQLGD